MDDKYKKENGKRKKKRKFNLLRMKTFNIPLDNLCLIHFYN